MLYYKGRKEFSLEPIGLKLNFKKTQYFTNQADSVGHISIGNIVIFKYLSHKLLKVHILKSY